MRLHRLLISIASWHSPLVPSPCSFIPRFLSHFEVDERSQVPTGERFVDGVWVRLGFLDVVRTVWRDARMDGLIPVPAQLTRRRVVYVIRVAGVYLKQWGITVGCHSLLAPLSSESKSWHAMIQEPDSRIDLRSSHGTFGSLPPLTYTVLH